MAEELKNMLRKEIGDNNIAMISAFKLERVTSNLKFLRECRRNKFIPKGFRCMNKIKDTITNNDYRCSKLMLMQSKQWMQLAIDALYEKKDRLTKNKVYPITYEQTVTLNRYRYLLRSVKRRKIASSKYDEKVNGFVNLSSKEFTDSEMALLSKGPSFIPPQRKLDEKAEIRLQAEIQSCHDRVCYRDKKLADSTQFAEFACGVKRITVECKTSFNKHLAELKNIKSKKCIIVPSDKTKRLVALDEDKYKDLIKKALNPSDMEVRQILPSSIQLSFNDVIGRICNKYRPSAAFGLLNNCKVSEPLPSIPYILPKDHKEGELKGRPIISTCNSVVRPLAQLLADTLNPMVKEHVSAHLSSTDDFIELIKELEIPQDCMFGSLDVTNLYGSIPIHDDGEHKGLISTVTEFFSEYGRNSLLKDVATDDFKILLTLCLTEDRYLLDGKSFKQSFGISMGNCAAPPLAIIFMNSIENTVIRKSNNSIVFWKRYIDDIFVVSTLQEDALLQLCNTVNPAIQFTYETPTVGKLAFLDLLVVQENNAFQYKLYVKPTHSGTCLPADSCVPISRKRNLIQSEFLRANNRSSKPGYKQESRNAMRKKFMNNGYTNQFIKNVVHRTERKLKEDRVDPLSYIKIPFISDYQRQRIIGLSKSTNMDQKIRIVFITNRPLSWTFREKRETLKCPLDCVACKTSIKQGQCFRKAVVYCIRCNLCDRVYIGQTARTIRSRIGEHVKTNTSQVFQHLAIHKSDKLNFTWEILEIESNCNRRMAIESLYMKKFASSVINSCESKALLPYLV